MQVQTQGAAAPLTGALAAYDTGGLFCELQHCVAQSPYGQLIHARLDALGLGELGNRARAAEAELYNQGITFTVYSDGDAIDRILPFDVIPRVITADDWAHDRGRRRPARAGAQPVPRRHLPRRRRSSRTASSRRELVLGNANYRPEMHGLDAAARHLCPHQRHRPRARRRRPLPGARGQRPHARPASPTWSRTGI